MAGDVYANRKKKPPTFREKYTKSRDASTKAIEDAITAKPAAKDVYKRPEYTPSKPLIRPGRKAAAAAPKMSNASNGPKSRPRPETKVPASGPKSRAPAKKNTVEAPAEKSAGMSFNGAPGQVVKGKKTTTNEHYNRPKSAAAPAAKQRPAQHTVKRPPATAHLNAEELLKKSRYNGSGGINSDRRR